VLVNNAGIYRPNIPFEEMPLDLWRQHFAINSDGVFLGCKHAIRSMKARGNGGAIVNMGSGLSITANPDGAAYCGLEGRGADDHQDRRARARRVSMACGSMRSCPARCRPRC